MSSIWIYIVDHVGVPGQPALCLASLTSIHPAIHLVWQKFERLAFSKIDHNNLSSILASICDSLTVTLLWIPSHSKDRLVGVVVKASASRAEDTWVRIPLAPKFFPGSTQTSDLKIVTPVATLPDAWHYRLSAGTGRPGVSIL